MLRAPALLVAVASFSTYFYFVPTLYGRPREQVNVEFQVALPLFVQVMLSAGDRYLAGNLAGFRALVVSTEKMDRQDYRILAAIQRDVSWLHPGHEDNYYIANAILPWYGELDAAQYILDRATDARPFDWQPAFFYGFNEWYFNHNPVVGAEWLLRAARNSQEDALQIQLQQMAARWVALGEDRSLAIRIHKEMARTTHHKAFAAFLEKRARRLEIILSLELAIERYQLQTGKVPRTLQEMVDAGLLHDIPVDPFGLEFRIQDDGKIAMGSTQPRGGQAQ